MKMTQAKKMLSFISCMVLIAAMALFAGGCNDKDAKGSDASNITSTQSFEAEDDGIVKLGEGKTQFDFIVIDKDGKETKFKISTDKTIVGEALVDVNLISGEESEYGLYVKTVNGQTLDFGTDKMYWALYINDVYQSKGVDTTEIVPGDVYMLKASK